MVNDGPVVGSIDGQVGFEIYMKIDGRIANPTLGLKFRCNREWFRRNQPVSGKDEDVETIKICFRPDLESTRGPGYHMMEQYQYGMLHTVDRANFTFWQPAVIQSLHYSQVPDMAVFRFYTWGFEGDAGPTVIWERYGGSDILHVLRVLFGAPPVGITIWTSLDHMTEPQWAGFATFDRAFKERSLP